MYVDANGNGRLDPGEESAVTDAAGAYALEHALAAGNAQSRLRVALFGGEVPLTPRSGVYPLSAGPSGLNFGLFVGSGGAGARRRGARGPSSGDPNEDFVRGLYRTLLAREGEPAGVQGWLKNLHDGLSRLAVVRAFLGSDEYLGDRVAADYYRTYLGGEGMVSEVAGWVAFLRQGGDRPGGDQPDPRVGRIHAVPRGQRRLHRLAVSAAARPRAGRRRGGPDSGADRGRGPGGAGAHPFAIGGSAGGCWSMRRTTPCCARRRRGRPGRLAGQRAGPQLEQRRPNCSHRPSTPCGSPRADCSRGQPSHEEGSHFSRGGRRPCSCFLPPPRNLDAPLQAEVVALMRVPRGRPVPEHPVRLAPHRPG